jgi:lauroyl/myristoyl acyltransferase
MTLRRRERSTTTRPWLTREDVAFAAELPFLWLFALAVPERHWPSVCRRLESAKAGLGLFEPAPVARIAERAIGSSQPGFDARAFALDSAAGRSEHHLQILRAISPGGWNAGIELVGREHVDAALAAGHGAVLWVAHFCFNALATKKAMAAAGYRVSHLSRPEHGFSKSRVGIATVNRLRVRAELAHLDGRIVIDRDKPMAATLAAQRLLKRNGIVSITAGAWEGQRLAKVDLLGGKLELAVGAPGLARLSGAALLPVFALRDPGDATLRVIVEPPIPVANVGDADAALQEAAQRFGELMERHVRGHPAQWRDWKNLKLPD